MPGGLRFDLGAQHHNKLPHTGSIARRMMVIAMAWILTLLIGGGFALERALTKQLQDNLDNRLEYLLNTMLVVAEIGPDGEVYFNRGIGEPRFMEPNSGLYFMISGKGGEDYPSRSLWDRSLKLAKPDNPTNVYFYDSGQFSGESLRIAQRSAELPFSKVRWTFAVASSRTDLDRQIAQTRAIIWWGFVVLGLGLMAMATLQSWYGLRPLRRIRAAIKKIRTTDSDQVTEALPLEVQPLVEEINMLLAHSHKQAEEARTHAGNLAHALKTPLTVLVNAADAKDPHLDELVKRETQQMQKQVGHHLARARAVGRRAAGLSRAEVGPSVLSVQRAISALYPKVRLDVAGALDTYVAIERQDLDEILGNVIENAAKYGGGSVFVTVHAPTSSDAEPDAEFPQSCEIWIEDDGRGIPADKRDAIFTRGTRLDTDKPGTGLGLAIVRDVTEIYGGKVILAESDDLGGLLVRLMLPLATR